MPANGPAGEDVLSASTDAVPAVIDHVPYALVRLTPDIVKTLSLYEPKFANSFTEPLHQAGQAPRTEQHEHDEDDDNPMNQTEGSHF